MGTKTQQRLARKVKRRRELRKITYMLLTKKDEFPSNAVLVGGFTMCHDFDVADAAVKFAVALLEKSDLRYSAIAERSVRLAVEMEKEYKKQTSNKEPPNLE